MLAGTVGARLRAIGCRINAHSPQFGLRWHPTAPVSAVTRILWSRTLVTVRLPQAGIARKRAPTNSPSIARKRCCSFTALMPRTRRPGTRVLVVRPCTQGITRDTRQHLPQAPAAVGANADMAMTMPRARRGRATKAPRQIRAQARSYKFSEALGYTGSCLPLTTHYLPLTASTTHSPLPNATAAPNNPGCGWVTTWIDTDSK